MLQNFRICKRNSSKRRTVFDVAAKKERIREITKELEDPTIWGNQEKFVALSKELSNLKDQVEEVGKLVQDLKDLQELAQADVDESELAVEAGRLAKRIGRVEMNVFLSGKYDRGPAICTITAGAGGQDAQDWAAMLLRMYERYCERKGWELRIIHRSFGERIMEKVVVYEISSGVPVSWASADKVAVGVDPRVSLVARRQATRGQLSRDRD